MRKGIRAAGVAALWLAATQLGAQSNDFEGRLSVVPIDPQTAPAIAGEGRVAAQLREARLSIDGRFEGLKGPATTAHLHSGVATGVRGEPIAELEVDGATSGSVAGEVELTPDQVAALRAGRLYVQLASESAPDGNLWGWLLPPRQRN